MKQQQSKKQQNTQRNTMGTSLVFLIHRNTNVLRSLKHSGFISHSDGNKGRPSSWRHHQQTNSGMHGEQKRKICVKQGSAYRNSTISVNESKNGMCFTDRRRSKHARSSNGFDWVHRRLVCDDHHFTLQICLENNK